jgi:hypothetical protein
MDLKVTGNDVCIIELILRRYAQKTAGEAETPNSGRRVLFGFTGWHERTGGLVNKACGISHLMPRDLSVAADGRIQIVPVPEIGNLKMSHTVLQINGAGSQLGSQVMVTLICDSVPKPTKIPSGVVPPRAKRAVGVDVLVDTVAGEWTRVGYDLDSGVLFVDQSKTNVHSEALSDAYQTTASLATVTGGAGVSELNITVLVDGGLLESYANKHVVISSLLSPSSNGSAPAEMRAVRAFTNTGHTSTSPRCVATAWKLRPVTIRTDASTMR